MAENYTLDQMAAFLAGMPSPEFRSRLKSRLTGGSGVKPGFRSLTPYLVVQDAARLIDFLKAAFDAKEVMRVPRPDGSVMHAQMEVAGSVIELADANEQWGPRPAALHLYVPDVDAVYARASLAGAVTLQAPVDQPYGDREAALRDLGGNHWYVATHKGASQLHDGLVESVSIYLHPASGSGMLEFLKSAFGGKEVQVHRSEDGVVRHAKVAIGSSVIEFGEAQGEWQPMPTGIHFYVEDCHAMYERALAAGGESLWPVAAQAYGEVSGGVKDPFGNSWFIATYTGGVQST